MPKQLPPCPRCAGRLYVDDDAGGRLYAPEIACLSCGYRPTREPAPGEDPDRVFAASGKQRRREPSMRGMRL